MTNRVLEGVGVGAEPLNAAGGASFGSLRSTVIYNALRHSADHGHTAEQFVQEVLAGLRRAGIDPARPHLNLPPASTP
jgi:hypothetical protein